MFEDAWFYYHDVAREQIDLAVVMKTVESVCSTLGLKLGQTWESYLTELPKLPWTSLYLTSLELENYDEDMKEYVLYALYFLSFFIVSSFYFFKKKLHILQLDWPADSNASLGGPVNQLLQIIYYYYYYY